MNIPHETGNDFKQMFSMFSVFLVISSNMATMSYIFVSFQTLKCK